MCVMPSLRSSPSKAVFPRHAVYWRPLSVKISRGRPKRPSPRSSASITSDDFWWWASAHPTMKREWSSMKPARYTRSCRRSRNVKMSDCHI